MNEDANPCRPRHSRSHPARFRLYCARQIADAPIPAQPHDIRLDMLATEREILRFAG